MNENKFFEICSQGGLVMFSRTAVVVGALAILFASANSDAAPARKGPAKKRPTAPAPKPLSPTEILVGQLFLNRLQEGENMGDACRRASFKNLAVALRMNSSLIARQKGEFETNAEYSEQAGKIAGVLSGEPILICETLDDNEDVPFRYDADNQLFDGSFSSSHNVWRDVKQLPSYRSKTRMGIPMTIKASIEFEYNVDFDMPSAFEPCLQGRYLYKFKVSQPLPGAPALKAAGKIAFQARLVPPYVSENEAPGEPSLDDPYDIYTFRITVHARPEKLSVIDVLGREIWSCEL